MDQISFSNLLKKSFAIFKKHWMELLGFSVVAGMILLIPIMLIGFLMVLMFAASGSTALIILGVGLAFVALVIGGVFISLSALRLTVDATKMEKISIPNALSYGLKNGLSFMWASITGCFYAFGWVLVAILAIPVLGILVKRSPSIMMLLSLLGFFAMFYAMYIGVKLIFMGVAFVQDEKRGVEAAKTSIALVTGRWWNVALNCIFLAILGSIAISIVTGILDGILSHNGVVKLIQTILQAAFGVMMSIFTILLYGAYKAPASHTEAPSAPTTPAAA